MAVVECCGDFCRILGVCNHSSCALPRCLVPLPSHPLSPFSRFSYAPKVVFLDREPLSLLCCLLSAHLNCPGLSSLPPLPLSLYPLSGLTTEAWPAPGDQPSVLSSAWNQQHQHQQEDGASGASGATRPTSASNPGQAEAAQSSEGCDCVAGSVSSASAVAAGAASSLSPSPSSNLSPPPPCALGLAPLPLWHCARHWRAQVLGRRCTGCCASWQGELRSTTLQQLLLVVVALQ